MLDLVSRWVRPEDVELERAVVYTFHSLLADRWRDRRVLLAGDAVHLQPPFQGQGLCSGIRDAGNLWWKLGLVLDGDADEALLDTYQSEREPHAKAWIVEATAVGAIVQTTDPEVARERDARLLAGDRGALRPIAPRIGPGLQPEAPPPAGTLSVQPRLPDGTLLDDAAGDRFVVAAEPELLDGLDAGAAYVLADPAPLLEAHGGRAVVVRPDRYLLGVAETRDELAALLERLPERLFPALVEQRLAADGFDAARGRRRLRAAAPRAPRRRRPPRRRGPPAAGAAPPAARARAAGVRRVPREHAHTLPRRARRNDARRRGRTPARPVRPPRHLLRRRRRAPPRARGAGTGRAARARVAGGAARRRTGGRPTTCSARSSCTRRSARTPGRPTPKSSASRSRSSRGSRRRPTTRRCVRACPRWPFRP